MYIYIYIYRRMGDGSKPISRHVQAIILPRSA